MLTSDLATLINQGGQAYAQNKMFSVIGYLSGTSQADLTQKENALKNALAVPYRDLILLNDDGSRSSEILLNNGSITGVIIEDLAFPRSEGPEYATIRSFTFRARAEYPLPGTGNYLLRFSETLSFSGGGPVFAVRRAINGPPQRQLVWAQTEYRATQSGSATGYRAYPQPAPPKFPQALKEAPAITPKSPMRKGNGYSDFEITWSYTFESAAPLVALPTVWIN